jgi:hypothetical protein
MTLFTDALVAQTAIGRCNRSQFELGETAVGVATAELSRLAVSHCRDSFLGRQIWFDEMIEVADEFFGKTLK